MNGRDKNEWRKAQEGNRPPVPGVNAGPSVVSHTDRDLLRSAGEDFDLEGRSKIAQRFIAGNEARKKVIPSRRDGRDLTVSYDFDRPSGT